MSGQAAVITLTTATSSTSSSSHSRTSYQTSKTQDTVRHLLTDDGQGSFGPDGTISYAGKFANVRLVRLDSRTEGYNSDFEDAKTFESTSMSGGGGDPGSASSTSKGGDRSDTSVSEEILAASTVTVTYAEGFASAQHHVMSYTPDPLTLDLCPYTTDYIVPGSVRFRWMGQVYEDYDGVLVRGRTAISPGIVAGALDYSSGVARITDYVVGGSPTDFAVESLWTVRQNWTTASIFMRTAAAPVKPSGFVMNLSDATGAQITAIAGVDGLITGDHLRGRIDYQTGVVELQFGDYVLDTSLTAAQKSEWWYSADDIGAVQPDKIWRPWPVDPTTLRYNSVSYFYLPLDETVIGLDPVRLPQDGRVPIYRVGGYLVIGHTGKIGPAQLTNGQTLNCGRTRLSRVYLVGADSKLIHQGWTVDLDAGLVSVQDTTGWVQPVRVFHRIEEMARASDVQISGAITLTKSLSHEFPVGSIVSNALMSGTLAGRGRRRRGPGQLQRHRGAHPGDQRGRDPAALDAALQGHHELRVHRPGRGQHRLGLDQYRLRAHQPHQRRAVLHGARHRLGPGVGRRQRAAHQHRGCHAALRSHPHRAAQRGSGHRLRLRAAHARRRRPPAHQSPDHLIPR